MVNYYDRQRENMYAQRGGLYEDEDEDEYYRRNAA
jgi:hypothetical protein